VFRIPRASGPRLLALGWWKRHDDAGRVTLALNRVRLAAGSLVNLSACPLNLICVLALPSLHCPSCNLVFPFFS
jgi:hypothetical protein